MQNMKEQEYKLTAITENMNEGLIMLDADRKIQYMNQSCQDLFEVSGSKFIGQTISGFCDSIPMQEDSRICTERKCSYCHAGTGS